MTHAFAQNLARRTVGFLRATWASLPGGVLALMVCSQLFVVAPLIVSHYTAPAGTKPSYYGYLTQDHSVYENYITQAKEGNVTFEDRFTSEPQAIGIFNIFWFAVGSIARALNLQPWAAIVLSRLILAPLVILALYYVTGQIFKSQESQNRVYLTAYLVFANGIGFLLTPLITPGPADVLAPEAMVNTILMTSPHMMLSFVLLILCYVLFFQWSQERKGKYLVAASLCGALLLQFHPYFAPIIPLTTGLWLAWKQYGSGQSNRQSQEVMTYKKSIAPYAAFLGVLALPMLYFISTLSDPFTQIRYATNITISQPLWSTIAAFSVLGVLAYKGFRAHKDQPFIQFAAVWIIVAFVMMYMPTPVNRRFLQGAIVPLGILAFLGIRTLVNAKSSLATSFFVQLRATALVFLTTIGGAINMLMIAQLIATAHIPSQLVAVTDFLKTQPAGVILGAPEDVAFMIGRTHHTAYVAHWSETIHLAQKTQFAKAFLDFPVHPELAHVIRTLPPLIVSSHALAVQGITYVVTPQVCPQTTLQIDKQNDLAVCKVVPES